MNKYIAKNGLNLLEYVNKQLINLSLILISKKKLGSKLLTLSNQQNIDQKLLLR
jgi:hypothetical protein